MWINMWQNSQKEIISLDMEIGAAFWKENKQTKKAMASAQAGGEGNEL